MRRSMDELRALCDSALPDNSSGAISPADIRGLIRDTLDTIAPSFGVLRLASGVIALTPTPASLIFQSVLVASIDWATSDYATGALARVPVAPLVNSRFTINGDVIGPLNNEVRVEVYANGVATGWFSTITAQGPSNRASFSFTAVHQIFGAVATSYTLKASAPNGSYTFENVLFVGENVPARSFVSLGF